MLAQLSHFSFNRLFILAFLITNLSNNLLSQDMDEVEKINKTSSIVVSNNKFGLLFMNKLVLPATHDDIYVLISSKNPLLYVMKNELVGVYKSSGEIVLPISYTSIDDNGSYFLLDKKGKYGILSHDGKIIIEAIYDKIEELEDGFGFILTKDGKSGVADQNGVIKIPVDFISVKSCNNYEDLTFQVETANNKAIYIENQENPKIKPMDGYIAASTSLFMKTNELSIVDWFAFLSDIKYSDITIDINLLIPDTNKVEKKLLPIYRILINELKSEEDSNLNYYTYKFTSSRKVITSIDVRITDLIYKNKLEPMLNFPVTGITYEQGLSYLKWLNQKYEAEAMNDFHGATFRFPTVDEWEQAAIKGLTDVMQQNKCLDSLNIKGCMLFIYKNLPKCKNYNDYIKYSFGEGSVSTKMLYPNLIGVYNSFGNVAEMTTQKGICKGGSYYHSAKEAKTTNSIVYENAEPWLGIRIVAEMKCIF